MAWTRNTEKGINFVIDGKNRRMPVDLNGLRPAEWLPINGETNSTRWYKKLVESSLLVRLLITG